MKPATRDNLKAHAKELLGNLWSPEQESELIREALTGLDATGAGHISHAQADHLERLNVILGTFGVEGIFEWKTGGSVDALNYDVDDVIDVQYCNTGDTYALTLLYWRERLWIGDWGSIVESEVTP